MDSLISKFKQFLPFVLDHKIVTEEELLEFFKWYQSQLQNRRENCFHQLFYDWVVSAIGENKKAESFLKFYNNVLSELYLSYNKTIPHEISTKIRNSILTKPMNQYKESIGELLAIWYLLKKAEKDYEYLGIDFKLGNEKDADIAFKKGSSIQLIEIKNYHHLVGKDLDEIIKKRIRGKLNNKTKDLPKINDYFSKNYPNYDVILSILLFIWEDYAEIADIEYCDNEIKKEIGDDFIPPITVINQKLKGGEYLWQVCALEDAIRMYREDHINNVSNTAKEKEEALTRRHFFKKAAGMIIPMMGLIAGTSLPGFMNATNANRPPSVPMNCGGSCSGSCSGDCSGSCDSGCSGRCGYACSGSCSNSCGRGCSSGCRGHCQGTCTSQCRDGCTSCKGTCTQTCLSGCGRLCSKDCTMGCSTGCEGCKGSCINLCGGCDYSCKTSCANDCSGTCKMSCSKKCAVGCELDCHYTCSRTCKNACTSMSLLDGL